MCEAVHHRRYKIQPAKIVCSRCDNGLPKQILDWARSGKVVGGGSSKSWSEGIYQEIKAKSLEVDLLKDREQLRLDIGIWRGKFLARFISSDVFTVET